MTPSTNRRRVAIKHARSDESDPARQGHSLQENLAADAGLDLDEEIANGAKEKTITPGFDPKTGAPLVDPNKAPMMAPSPRMEAPAAGAIKALVEGAK